MRPLADQHRARLGGLLEAGGDVDRVAGDELIALPAERGDHVARVDADPDRQRDAVALLEGGVELLEPLEHLERGADRAHRVVVVDGRHAEDRDDRVADVLLERAAPRRDHLGHRLEVGAQQRAQPLGIEPLAELGRADHVGEEDRRELALLAERPRLRCAGRAGHRLRGGRRRRRLPVQLQRRVLVQDLPLELLQRRAGLDPELVDERTAPASEDVERVGLPAAAIERDHQLAAQALAKRVLGDERLELRHELVLAAERQVGVDPLLDGREALLLEARDLALGERLVAEVGQRLPVPERERLAQAGRPLLGIGQGARLPDEQLEPAQVDLARRDVQQVAGRPRPDPLGADQLADGGDVPVQRGLRGLGRRVAPDALREADRRCTSPSSHSVISEVSSPMP